jgi:hypothetical protein
MMALVSSSTGALPVREINQDTTNKNREIPKIASPNFTTHSKPQHIFSRKGQAFPI